MKKFLKEQFTFDTVQVVTMGLLIAIEIVLNRFASFNVWNLKIGLAFVPVMLSGMLMGPVKAGIVGALSDFLGAILFPIGAYFPGFTFGAFLKGVLYGALLYKKQSVLNITITSLIDQLVISLFVTSIWISILYGSPYMGVVYTRLVQVLPLAPVELIIGVVLAKSLVKPLKTFMNQIPQKNKDKSKQNQIKT